MGLWSKPGRRNRPGARLYTASGGVWKGRSGENSGGGAMPDAKAESAVGRNRRRRLRHCDASDTATFGGAVVIGINGGIRFAGSSLNSIHCAVRPFNIRQTIWIASVHLDTLNSFHLNSHGILVSGKCRTCTHIISIGRKARLEIAGCS